jgi:GTP-binding protein
MPHRNDNFFETMSTIYHHARFLLSVAELPQLPADVGLEVAFAGRSNAGKSSALNALTQQKLARASKTPGRTQLINLFSLDDHRRLVDLPGYGYAEVPQAVKARWQQTLGEYLRQRQSLAGIVLLMDCRHPLKDMDLSMVGWANAINLPMHILLTKADKFSNNQKFTTLKKVEKALADFPNLSIQMFSALSKEGLDTLKQRLNTWYQL